MTSWSMIVMYFQHAASRRGICHVLGLVDGAPWGGTHRASPIYEALFSASALAVCKILGMPSNECTSIMDMIGCRTELT